MKKIIFLSAADIGFAEIVSKTCSCQAEQYPSLKEAQEQIEQGHYDFLIIDPFYYSNSELIFWLKKLQQIINGNRPKVVIFSSWSEAFIRENYALDDDLYDHFVLDNPWQKLKAIIN